MKLFKRFLSLILTCILIFSITVPCYASDTNADQSDPAGWSAWSFAEKIQFVEKYGLNIICGLTGIAHGDISAFKECVLDAYAIRPEAGVTNFYEYLANGLSFDDSTETWELSDDLVSFLNDFITYYNDQVTMVYRYPVQLQNISAETFVNKTVYDAFIAVCQQYPSSYIITSSEPVRSWRGTMFTALDGSKSDGVWDSSWDNFTEIFVIPQPLAGVSQYFDLSAASTSFYDDNWEQHLKCITYVFAPDGRWYTRKNGDFYYGSSVGANWHYTNSIVEIEPFTFPSYDELTDCGAPNNSFSYTTFLSSSYGTSFSARTCYSCSPNALNVYKSEADMKKDIGSQFIGSYTNTYTGTTVNNITQTEINNIVNNYYPSDPDPAPDDPGGGGGSSSESKDYTFLLQRIISEIQNLNFSDLNDTLKEIKVLVSNIYQNMYDFSDMDANITDIKNFMQDVVDQLDELNDNLVALSRSLVGKDAFEDALSGVKSNFPDPDDIILASVNELAELQDEALSFGGALGDIFFKLLDFQTGIDDLVQDEEYIDEVEGLLRQLLPKDPEDNDDDSFFDKVLKTIEMSLQLYANSVDEIKETSKKKFPFSIGYDIELLLMLLSAEPQTPVFTIPFEYGRINYKSDIVIDFSMFDDSIDVIRFFLTIYYCFFLLMITPKMIGLNNEVDS